MLIGASHHDPWDAGVWFPPMAPITASVEKGLKPDFWMKSLHPVYYWSARPGERTCDNIWCDDPIATVKFMKQLD